MQTEAISKAYATSEEIPTAGSLSTIRDLVGQGNTVLDVGCATGYLGQLCKGNDFYGIDGNSDAIEEADRVYRRALCLDLNELPVTIDFDTQFDVIVFADVLEHLLHPELVLKELAQHLVPGGRVIVSLPNVGLWRVRMNLLRGKFEYADYGVLDRTHLHFYTFETGKRLLEQSGFAVDRVVPAANALGPIVKKAPVLRGLLAINMVIEAHRSTV